MVPHLVTALTGPINELEQRVLDSMPAIERWFRLEWMEHTPPFYTSVDIRNAGFKLAPVDTNLFPGGWNNLTPEMLPLAVQAAMAAIEKICPEAKNLLVIPEKSHHKDLSAKFIDYVLSDDVQNFLGNAGGIPVAADTSKITDAKSKAMIEEYDSYAKDGKLSYYPDYAASNLTDAVPAEFQELVNGTKKPADVLKNIHEKYDTGVEDMGVKNN